MESVSFPKPARASTWCCESVATSSLAAHDMVATVALIHNLGHVSFHMGCSGCTKCWHVSSWRKRPPQNHGAFNCIQFRFMQSHNLTLEQFHMQCFGHNQRAENFPSGAGVQQHCKIRQNWTRCWPWFIRNLGIPKCWQTLAAFSLWFFALVESSTLLGCWIFPPRRASAYAECTSMSPSATPATP